MFLRNWQKTHRATFSAALCSPCNIPTDLSVLSLSQRIIVMYTVIVLLNCCTEKGKENPKETYKDKCKWYQSVDIFLHFCHMSVVWVSVCQCFHGHNESVFFSPEYKMYLNSGMKTSVVIGSLVPGGIPIISAVVKADIRLCLCFSHSIRVCRR